MEMVLRDLRMAVDNTSARLVSGFRGCGKTTELLRLRSRLEQLGYAVVYIDLDQVANTAVPLQIGSFLLTVAGAFSDAVDGDPGASPEERRGKGSFWQGFKGFLGRIKVDVGDIEAGFEGAGFGVSLTANLSLDPTFKRRLDDHMATHLGALTLLVNQSMQAAARRIDRGKGVVFMVDSLEHFTDADPTESLVRDSVQSLLTLHAEKLQLEGVHTIYTVPPYAAVRAGAALTAGYDGEIAMFGAVKVRTRDQVLGETTGVHQPGVDHLVAVVAARVPEWRRLLADEQLRALILASGGHLRDLMRLLQAVIRRADFLPADDDTVRRALEQVRREFRVLDREGARWLRRFHRDPAQGLDTDSENARLAHFLDLHLLLAYRNDRQWFALHPLVADEVDRLVAG